MWFLVKYSGSQKWEKVEMESRQALRDHLLEKGGGSFKILPTEDTNRTPKEETMTQNNMTEKQVELIRTLFKEVQSILTPEEKERLIARMQGHKTGEKPVSSADGSAIIKKLLSKKGELKVEVSQKEPQAEQKPLERKQLKGVYKSQRYYGSRKKYTYSVIARNVKHKYVGVVTKNSDQWKKNHPEDILATVKKCECGQLVCFAFNGFKPDGKMKFKLVQVTKENFSKEGRVFTSYWYNDDDRAHLC